MQPVGLVELLFLQQNPTSTAIFKTLIALKTRNAIIISPHPRAKKSTRAAAMLVYEAAVKAGSTGRHCRMSEEPTVEMSGSIMANADVILCNRISWNGKGSLLFSGKGPSVLDL